MGGRRFKKKKRKLNMKKVVLVILIPFILIGLYFGYTSIIKKIQNYQVKRVQTITYLAHVDKSGKWGVINSQGEKIVENKWDDMVVIPRKDKDVFIVTEVEEYEKGKYKTKVFNRTGNEIFKDLENVKPIEYRSKDVIYDQELLSFTRNGKVGFVDFDGVVKVEPDLDEYEIMGNIEGKVKVKQGDKFGVLATKTHTYIVPTIYVKVEPINEEDTDTAYDIVFENKHGIIASTSKKVLPTEYDEIKKVKSKDMYVASKAGNTAIYNSAGEEKGKYIQGTEQIVDDVVIYSVNGKKGAKTIEGKQVLSPKYSEIEKISLDKYIAKEDKYNIYKSETLADNKLQETRLLEKDYDKIFFYKEGELLSLKDGNETEISVLDLDKKIKGTILEHNKDGYIRVRNSENSGKPLEEKFYNFKLEEIYESQAYKGNNLFRYVENGKVGFKNEKDNIVVPPIYDDATYQNTYGYIAVNRDGKWGSIDYNGEIVLQPTLDLKEHIVIQFIKEMYRIKEADIIAFTN